jgi:acetolactate synthase-1/2/3 large subunit
MWAAQFFGFEEPNRWMTSGGLGTMGYGLPAALGVQMAHPDALVIDIAGDASVLMTIQEMSAAVQYNAADQDLHPQQPVYGHGAPVAAAAARQPAVAFLHGGLPDFVKLAEAYGGTGIRLHLDDARRIAGRSLTGRRDRPARR